MKSDWRWDLILLPTERRAGDEGPSALKETFLLQALTSLSSEVELFLNIFPKSSFTQYLLSSQISFPYRVTAGQH